MSHLEPRTRQLYQYICELDEKKRFPLLDKNVFSIISEYTGNFINTTHEIHTGSEWALYKEAERFYNEFEQDKYKAIQNYVPWFNDKILGQDCYLVGYIEESIHKIYTWREFQSILPTLTWEKSMVYDRKTQDYREPKEDERSTTHTFVSHITMLDNGVHSFIDGDSWIKYVANTKTKLIRYQVGDFIGKHRDDTSRRLFIPPGVYEGGDLYIEGQKQDINKNEWTTIVIDVGKEHYVTKITSGVRYVFVTRINESRRNYIEYESDDDWADEW